MKEKERKEIERDTFKKSEKSARDRKMGIDTERERERKRETGVFRLLGGEEEETLLGDLWNPERFAHHTPVAKL